MDEILRGKFFSLYSQIALVDVETPDAYPEWITGDEIAAIGPNGVAIPTLGDTFIDVIIYKGRGDVDGIEYASGFIEVGNQGLLVGNIAASSYTTFAWPSGKTAFKVYADKPKNSAKSLFFVLEVDDEPK